MQTLGFTLFAVSLTASIVTAISGSIAKRDNITDNVLEVTVNAHSSGLHSPSSHYRTKFLRKRRAPITQEELISPYGRSYYAKVTVGGQLLALVIDTGSDKTWIATTNFYCLDRQGFFQPQAACMLGPLFDPTASRSFTALGNRFGQRYLDRSSIAGFEARDQLGIGGLNGGPFPYIATDLTLGIANEGTWNGENIGSGLIGLSFPRGASEEGGQESAYKSILYTLQVPSTSTYSPMFQGRWNLTWTSNFRFQQTSIPPVFSLALNRTPSDPRSPAGLLTLGGIPNVQTDDHWVETPTLPAKQDSHDYYSIQIDGFDITPPFATLRRWHTSGPYTSYRLRMSIDSGASSLYIPAEVASYIASQFIPHGRYDPFYKRYFVTCNAHAPRVGIKIAGNSYYISKDDLLVHNPEHPSGDCQIDIEPTNGGFYVLGDMWLKNVLVVFDMSNYMYAGSTGSNEVKHGVIRIAGRETY